MVPMMDDMIETVKNDFEKFFDSKPEIDLDSQFMSSPSRLAENLFFWEAVTRTDNELDRVKYEITVPIPSRLLTEEFFTFFVISAYKLLFTDEVIDSLPEIETGDPDVNEAFEEKRIYEKSWVRNQGLLYLQYMFYVLFHQYDDDVREIMIRCNQQGNITNIFKEIDYKDKVEKFIENGIDVFVTFYDKEAEKWVTENQKIKYKHDFDNLIPLAMDLHEFSVGEKKPVIKYIDNESIKERAEAMAAYL